MSEKKKPEDIEATMKKILEGAPLEGEFNLNTREGFFIEVGPDGLKVEKLIL